MTYGRFSEERFNGTDRFDRAERPGNFERSTVGDIYSQSGREDYLNAFRSNSDNSSTMSNFGNLSLTDNTQESPYSANAPNNVESMNQPQSEYSNSMATDGNSAASNFADGLSIGGDKQGLLDNLASQYPDDALTAARDANMAMANNGMLSDSTYVSGDSNGKLALHTPDQSTQSQVPPADSTSSQPADSTAGQPVDATPGSSIAGDSSAPGTVQSTDSVTSPASDFANGLANGGNQQSLLDNLASNYPDDATTAAKNANEALAQNGMLSDSTYVSGNSDGKLTLHTPDQNTQSQVPPADNTQTAQPDAPSSAQPDSTAAQPDAAAPAQSDAPAPATDPGLSNDGGALSGDGGDFGGDLGGDFGGFEGDGGGEFSAGPDGLLF